MKKMTSDESRVVVSFIQEDEYYDIDIGFDHDDHQPHRHNSSTFSMCTSSIDTNDDDDDNDDIGIYMSRLSIESFDSDADEDVSGEELLELSDKEPCYFTLPTVPPPPHRRNQIGMITRPKGGRRSLRMDMEEMKACGDLGFELEEMKACGDLGFELEEMKACRDLGFELEEMKACRDLGFELEHERMLEKPSSGWRISSPGDDPRDVKARLRMWAQAVALASTLKNGS